MIRINQEKLTPHPVTATEIAKALKQYAQLLAKAVARKIVNQAGEQKKETDEADSANEVRES